jgi:hypothetical protein
VGCDAAADCRLRVRLNSLSPNPVKLTFKYAFSFMW